LRRSLGFKLHDAGRALAKFASFMEQQNAEHHHALALDWAQQPSDAQPAHWAQRSELRAAFARHHVANDPRHRGSAARLAAVSTGTCPALPLFASTRSERLLEQALQLPPNSGLRPWTYHALLGLLSVTGLRVGEALRLRLDDVDLDAGVLTVRGTKFGKSRLVPIHASTRDVLADYRTRRANHLGGRDAPHFFVTPHRQPTRRRRRAPHVLPLVAPGRTARE
jgi:integrase/recombinase XerD